MGRGVSGGGEGARWGEVSATEVGRGVGTHSGQVVLLTPVTLPAASWHLPHPVTACRQNNNKIPIVALSRCRTFSNYSITPSHNTTLTVMMQ